MGSLVAGDCLLHYRILDKLGQGGMGEVYRAEDTRLGRHVAVKVIAANELKDEKARLRLLREARSVSSLNHPNIVTIHAIEKVAERDFLVMELIEGKDLRLRTIERRLELDELIEVGAQIAGALAAAHSAQIIHRDIKPANIMLTTDGLVKVLDFGLAKPAEVDHDLTTAGLVVGTIAYMSPEQLRGEPLDSRTDLFSLGCVLYEAATGQRPFQSDSLPELMQELTKFDPAPPSTIRPELGLGFDRVIQRAMAKDREQRYETAGQLRSELRALRSDPTVTIARAAEPAETHPAPAPLIVGRDAQLQRLNQLLASAARGSGKVVFVSGEAGIGKTSLVEEFLSSALRTETALLVGRGRCVEQYGTGEAYLPFLEAISALASGLAGRRIRSVLRTAAPTWCLQLPAIFGAESRELQQETLGATKDRMMREMADALEMVAAISPVILFLEDLHWADAASVDLMRHLCQRMGGQRQLIIGTLRPADLEMRNHPLRSYRLEMQTHRVCEEIPLDLLVARDVAGYLDARFAPNAFPGELAEMIHSRTEGHSLFVTTLAQLLAERGDIELLEGRWTLSRPLAELTLEVPPSVMSMIRKQLEGLSEDDRHVLECASIQGEEFLSVPVAEALSQDELAVEERLERLARTHGIVKSVSEAELPGGTFAVKYRFCHALHQNVLYDDALPRRRVQLHRKTGESLERHYGGQAPAIAAQLAMHFERGREFSRAIDYLICVGDTAVVRCAHAEAVDRYSQALELVERVPAEQQHQRRAVLYQKRGAALGGLGRWNESEADGLRMLEEARSIPDVAKQTAALLQVGAALFWSHQLTRMATFTQEALQVARQSNEEKLIIEAQVAEGMRLQSVGELDAAADTLEDCMARARRLQHKPGLAGAMVFRINVYSWQGEYELAERLGREVVPLAMEARNPIWTLQALFVTGYSLVNQGRMSEGIGLLKQTLEQFQRNGALYHVARLSNTLGWAHRELGDFERGAEYDRQGIEFGQKYKAREGELSSWINLTREFTRNGENDRAREAFHLIEEKAAHDEWHRWLFLDIRYQATAAEHFLTEGDADRAEKHLMALRSNAARCGARKHNATGGRLAGELAAMRGDLSTAEGELLAAANLLRERPAPLAAWRIWAALGAVRKRRNDADGARQAYRQSSTILDQIAANIAEGELRAKFLGADAATRVRSALEDLS